MSKASPTRRRRRLNLRALAILGGLFVLALPGLLALKAFRDVNDRGVFLKQAKKQVAAKKPALALGYLNRYLELNPNDLEALELKGQVLADDARTEGQAADAVKVLNGVLTSTRDSAHAAEILRRIAKLNLRIKGRERSVVEQTTQLIEGGANGLIKGGATDAEVYRLRARANERIGREDKNRAAIISALRDYEKAEAKDPGDVEGAEALATLYRDRLDDPEQATKILDRLVGSTAKNPSKHAAALLARARHFMQTRQNARMQADIDQAVRDDPTDLSVRLTAADTALLYRDAKTAREHLAAIAPEHRDDMRVKISMGYIEMAEQRPDEAIQSWREGLVKTGGNNADLTWQLAEILLDNNRIAEAEPLMDQYRRLSGDGSDKDSPPYHYLHAMALIKKGRPGDAVPELEAIKYKTSAFLEARVYFLLGQAYEALHETAKATEAYQQAAGTSRSWSSPWLAVARIQAAANDPEAAAATLRKAMVQNENDPRLMTALARVLWHEEQKKPKEKRSAGEVERVLSEARRTAPGSAEVALFEADYYWSEGRPDEAVALLRTAAKMENNRRSPEVWLALVNTLARRGHLGEALEAVDQAVAAAGPQAAFSILRSSLLVMKGQIAEARAALKDGLTRVPADQRPVLWKTLGDFYMAQSPRDLPAARASYEQWAKLQPENPEPRLSLVETAIAGGDDAAISRAVDAVKGVGGGKSYHWRLARIEELLRDRKEAPDAARDKARLVEATTLVNEIKTNDPQLALGHLLEGRIAEKQKDTKKAIDAYQAALKRGAGPLALNPLVALLVRENRNEELEALRKTSAGQGTDLNRLAVTQALRQGNKGRAEQLAAQAVQGDPQALDVRVWQAEVLQALGKPEQAEAALQVLIGEQPTRPAPWLQLLMLQVARKQTAKAAETIARMRKAVTDVEFPELLWAQCYRASGDVRRAEASYQDALKRWPNDLNVLRSALSFFDQIGRRTEAEDLLRSVLRAAPGNAWATRSLALSLASRVGNRPAWDEAVKLVGSEPRPDDTPEDLVARAEVFSNGPAPADRQKAIGILQKLLGELPNLPKVHELLARLLFSAGDTAGAREHAARAAADKAGPEAVLFYAGVLLAAKDPAGAEEQLSRLTAYDPDGLPVAELKARILTARGRGGDAAKVLEKAFADRTNSPDALLIGEKMVTILLGLKQPEAAGRVARRLSELGPRGRCDYADFLAGQGKPDEAAAQLAEAAKSGQPAAAAVTALNLATRPKADPRWLGLADQYFASASAKNEKPSFDRLQQVALLRHFQRKYDQEVAAYRAMLEAKPANYSFLNNMAWTLSEELNRPEEGLKAIDDAVRRLGRVPFVLDTRGVILTRLGRYDDAVRDLNDAARSLSDPTVYYHLARAYKKMGKDDDFQKYRDLAAKGGLAREQLQSSEQADWDSVMKR